MARSRRTTPFAQGGIPASTAPPAGRARRSQSQTHEPARAPATQPAHTNRRSARAKSVESAPSITVTAPRTRRRVGAPEEIQQVDLTTVDERSDAEDVDLEIPPPDEGPEVRATPGDDEEDPVGDRSLHSMSGTTVRSDHQSEDGDDDWNPHTLLTYGPAVYRAAANLIRRFDQHKPILLQILKAIDRSASSTEISFQKDIDSLEDAVLQLGEAFGNGLNLLSPDHVMAGLFKQALPNMTSECWRVTELMQLLNLAIISRKLASTPTETDEMADNLRKLDVQFPFAFLKNLNMSGDSPQIVGNSYLRDETFEVALAIRLQTTVLEIQRGFGSDGFSTSDFIHAMFFAAPGTQESLRAWDVNGLGSGDLGLLPEYDSKMRRKIKRLISCVEDDEQEIADGSEDGMQILTRNFPWLEFRATVLRWAKLRMEEITASIDGATGIEKLMDEVRVELSKDVSFDPNAVIPLLRSPAKQKARATGSRTQARQSSIPILNSSPLRSTDGNAVRNPRTQADEPTLQTVEEFEKSINPDHEILLLRMEENQRQRKENIRQQPATTVSPSRRRQFVDEQEDAERITNFDEATQPPPEESAPRNPIPASRSKRKRSEATANEDDVTDDEGFESDNRQVDASQRRRDAPRPGLSPKKVRIREPDQEAPDDYTREDAFEEVDPIREYEAHKKISSSQAARAVQSSLRQPKPRQSRRGWSAAEELRLEEYISDYGISWAYLKELDKEDGNLFEGRDQVALKDKARNMKTQMLLDGVDPLPRNWNLVALDRKAIDRLQRGGVDEARLQKAGVSLSRLP